MQMPRSQLTKKPINLNLSPSKNLHGLPHVPGMSHMGDESTPLSLACSLSALYNGCLVVPASAVSFGGINKIPNPAHLLPSLVANSCVFQQQP